MIRIVKITAFSLLLLSLVTPIKAFNLNDLGNLLARADSVVNQVDQFTDHQTYVQRILAISSSTTSIVFCSASIYCFFAIDPRRLVFRHQLIFFLLFFDLMKACILLLYPARVLTNYLAYFNAKFCHVVGFFTATAIEGADFAILTFAIHTYLLILKTNLNVRVGNSRRIEGGLYIYRFYVYGISFLIPLILASLAFVKNEGYQSFVCWCYLPQYPVWYRMVLSWVPRYLILLTIFFCYASIYYHVIKQIRHLGGVFTTTSKKKFTDISEKPSFFSALKYFLNTIKRKILPELTLPEQNKEFKEDVHPHRSNSRMSKEHGDNYGADDENDDDDDLEDIDDVLSSDDDISDLEDMAENDEGNVGSSTHQSPINYNINTTMTTSNSNLDNHGTDIHLENLKNFKKRQRIIKKQMKSIFIYPLAYVFIWLFPFILYVTQVNYERHHQPIYFLNCLGAFMQPFNGTVDSIVFFIRETPWKYTAMNKFKRDHSERMDSLLNRQYHDQRQNLHTNRDSRGSLGLSSHHNPSISHSHRQSLRSHSLYDSSISNNTNSRSGSGVGRSESFSHHNHSLSANLNVDLSRFKKWRFFLNDLNLPLFQLPTEKNLTKLQDKFISEKLHENQDIELTDNQDIEMSEQKLDFSNVLQGNLVEDEFRSTLENFSLNFNDGSKTQGKRLSNSSLNHTTVNSSPHNRKNSFSSKSYRSRQFSVDPNEPVIIEGKLYDSGDSTSSPNTKNSPTNSNFPHRPTRNSYNSGNTLAILRGNSGSSTPNKKLSRGTLDTRTSLTGNDESDGEMDFMEFLKKGPP